MGRKPLFIEQTILEQIFQQLKEGKPQYQIAKDFGLSAMTISRLKKKGGFSNNGGSPTNNNDSPIT